MSLTLDRRAAVERHLRASTTLIEDVCLLPAAAGDAHHAQDERCVAVVVPRASELSAQQVLLPRARLRELLHAVAASAPHAIRIEDVAVVPGPLPRTADGALARDAVARLLEVRLWGEADLVTGAELARPAALRLLERLPLVLETPGPYRPEQRLEEDLGVDSLALVQLRVLLEAELGVRVADEDVWRVRTVRDLLALVGGASPAATSPAYTWAARLREPVVAPLEVRFNLRRRGLRRAAAQLGMWTLTALAKLAFRIELVHGERLPREGPFLLCPTHQSMLDSPLIYATFPYAMVHRTVFVAFGPYFRAAPLSWLVRMGRLILTGEGGSVADSLRLAFDGLRRGLVVCVFPEGGCSYSGDVMAPRPGVGILACEAQVPVVPVVFEGSWRTCSPRHPELRPVKIRVLVGEPIPPPPPKDAWTRADYMAVADRWREAVVRLQLTA